MTEIMPVTISQESLEKHNWLLVDDKNTRIDKVPVRFDRRIKQLVGEAFDITPIEIDSARRNKRCFIPRHVFWFLCKILTPLSFPEIGRRSGGKDHTSVLHGVDLMPDRMLRDPFLCQRIIELQTELENEISRWRGES